MSASLPAFLKKFRGAIVFLFAFVFVLNLIFGAGFFGALIRTLIFTMIGGAVLFGIGKMMEKNKDETALKDDEPLLSDDNALKAPIDDDDDGDAEGSLQPAKPSYKDDEIFQIVTDGQYREPAEAVTAAAAPGSLEKNTVAMENQMLEEQFDAPKTDLGLPQDILADVPEAQGGESELAGRSGGKDGARQKNLGKYILINKKKLPNDPEGFAQAIRTMISRDEE